MGIVERPIAHLVAHGSFVGFHNFSCQSRVVLGTFLRYFGNAGDDLLLRTVLILVNKGLSLGAKLFRLGADRLVEDLATLSVVLHVRSTVDRGFRRGCRVHERRGEVLRTGFGVRNQEGRLPSGESWRHELAVLARVESLAL